MGKVILDTNYPRGTTIDDSTRLPLVARALDVPLDTVRQSQLPACLTDTTARGPKGYRVTRVSLSLDYVSVNGASRTRHYIVGFERMCRREYYTYYLGNTVRIDAVPDTEFSFKWAVGNVETSADPPREPEPTFTRRHATAATFFSDFVFFGSIAFPILALLAGSLGGRSALKWALGIWSLAGLVPAALVGMPLLAAWLILFVVPPSVYVARALMGVEDKPDSLAFGRATVAFAITYPICAFLFLIALS